MKGDMRFLAEGLFSQLDSWNLYFDIFHSVLMYIVYAQGWDSLLGFSSELLHFCERKNGLLVKKGESLPLLFCHERQERIVQGPLFVKSIESELLFYRAMRAIHSWLHFFQEQPERIALCLSFFKSDEKSDSLTVDIFLRTTRAKSSQSLNNMSNFERKSEELKSKFPFLLLHTIEYELLSNIHF